MENLEKRIDELEKEIKSLREWLEKSNALNEVYRDMLIHGVPVYSGGESQKSGIVYHLYPPDKNK